MREYTGLEEWLDQSAIPREKWKEISNTLPYLASEEALPNPWPTKLRAMVCHTTLSCWMLFSNNIN